MFKWFIFTSLFTKYLRYHPCSDWSRGVFAWEYVNMVVTKATGKNFSFNQCRNKEKSNKSNRNFFSCLICIAWYKLSRCWENSWQLYKPLTSSWVCITVLNSPNPSRVYIRICKHRKRFLLLKCFLLYHRLIMRVSLLKERLKLHPWNHLTK